MAINNAANFDPAGAGSFALQSALSAYSDEMYTNAKKLTGTAIVGSNAQIDPSTETFIGQTRFFKPYSTQTVNVANTSAEANGTQQEYVSEYMTYVKTVRTHGAREVNVQRVVSGIDGLAKIARDFGEVRAQDEHESVMAVLRGVAGAEAAYGSTVVGASSQVAGGLADFGYDYRAGVPTAGTTGDNVGGQGNGFGFYVDTNAAGAYGTSAGTGAGRGLIMSVDEPGVMGYGAILGENLFTAVSLGYADYEPDYCYLITSPRLMTQLRVANLVDQTTVMEGNLEFQTIFGGKFRLLMTRTPQGSHNGTDGVEDLSTQTTFLVKPGALEMASLSVPMPVEMFRNANTFAGGGSTDIWYRWGYVIHPMGYNWTGSAQAFASSGDGNDSSDDVARNGLGRARSAAVNNDQGGTGTNQYIDGSNWERQYDALNLGILPIFHS